MRALGSWLRHALFRSAARFSLSDMETLAPRVVRIAARAPDAAAWRRFSTAEPGQFAFVRVRAPGVPPVFRPLSMAGIDRKEMRLSFLVKGNGPWSLALYDAQPKFPKEKAHSEPRTRFAGGAELPWLIDLVGPCGRFTLRRGAPRGCEGGPLVFIAGGIGIAPFLAMATDLSKNAVKRRLLILWAAGTREDLAGLDELISLAKANPAIRTVPILSHDPLWEGRKGRIDGAALDALAKAELCDPTASFWLCAPRPLRKIAIKALKERRVPGRRIRVESFGA